MTIVTNQQKKPVKLTIASDKGVSFLNINEIIVVFI